MIHHDAKIFPTCVWTARIGNSLFRRSDVQTNLGPENQQIGAGLVFRARPEALVFRDNLYVLGPENQKIVKSVETGVPQTLFSGPRRTFGALLPN